MIRQRRKMDQPDQDKDGTIPRTRLTMLNQIDKITKASQHQETFRTFQRSRGERSQKSRSMLGRADHNPKHLILDLMLNQ